MTIDFYANVSEHCSSFGSNIFFCHFLREGSGRLGAGLHVSMTRSIFFAFILSSVTYADPSLNEIRRKTTFFVDIFCGNLFNYRMTNLKKHTFSIITKQTRNVWFCDHCRSTIDKERKGALPSANPSPLPWQRLATLPSLCHTCDVCAWLTHFCPPFQHLLSERHQSLGQQMLRRESPQLLRRRLKTSTATLKRSLSAISN